MTTIYVATTGNDTTGNGNSVNPYATPGKAFAVASNGDTISFAAGTYTMVDGITNTANLTLIGAGATTTILDGANAAISWRLGTAVNIRDLQFRNASIKVTDSNQAQPIIGLTGTNSTLTFTRCVFRNFHGDTSNGCMFGWSIGGATGTLIFNSCIFWGIYGTNVAMFYFRTNGVPTLTMVNCSFYLSVQFFWGVMFGRHDQQVAMPIISVKNSIFHNATGQAIFFRDTSLATNSPYYISFSSFQNNCAYNLWTVPPEAISTITGDPKFVDASGGNFNLRPTSPCINTGTLT